MAAEINIDKKTVSAFLSAGKMRQYLIPEYQRPYAWTDDQIVTLFDDIWEFATSIGGFNNEQATYFLGSIVSFENKERNVVEIIDGQQRLTSLCLLLRAIYAKLENQTGKSAKHLAGQIEPALWKTDPRTGDVDKTKPLFRSDVVSDGGNKTIEYILMTGLVAEGAKDNYSKNYRKFQELLEKADEKASLSILDFVHAVLNQAIVLPITADSQDTALTIFSTLNNRGLPLSDADIFKAKIYSHFETDDAKTKRDEFIAAWKTLEERAESANETVQSLFYYDMFFERAKEKDQKTTTPGVRRYFLENDAKRLLAEGLTDRLSEILTLFELINKGIAVEDESWMSGTDILRSLDILKSYPNEFWKYPVITYFLKYHHQTGFADAFRSFLKRLVSFLLIRYLERPTISAVKGDVLKLDSAIMESPKPTFASTLIDRNELRSHIVEPHPKVLRMLLKILAYNRQSELLPAAWDVEHIFPQHWENCYFPNLSDEYVRGRVEHLGNKVPFETVKNIKASNGFFAKKKELYKTSKIAIVRELVEIPQWNLDEIAYRDGRVSDEIFNTLESWIMTYDNPHNPVEK